jgi:CRP/FNR family transcriptional regulator, dissimilatory nitrate respiration regulator
MLPTEFIEQASEVRTVAPGSVLLRRGVTSDCVMHVESGRVAMGVTGGDGLTHQLGEVEGPFWLDATDAVLAQPSVVDAVAESEVRLRRTPLSKFRQSLSELPASAQMVLHDVAQAHRQQTELAVSRLAKDAEARCAEWLLQHAQASDIGMQAVVLRQTKGTLAAQLGIAPETLSRVLRHLRERSLISGTGRALKLLDPRGLRRLAGI